MGYLGGLVIGCNDQRIIFIHENTILRNNKAIMRPGYSA